MLYLIHSRSVFRLYVSLNSTILSHPLCLPIQDAIFYHCANANDQIYFLIFLLTKATIRYIVGRTFTTVTTPSSLPLLKSGLT